MKVLLIAPQPFYQERGTPIAVDLLLRALSERGDTVDVLTYHEGKERTYPGVTIYRIAPRLRIRNVRPGPSAKKVVCDLYLFASLIRRLRRESYDVIHAVEESAFMAAVLRPFTGTPFIYDMDSSMATQILDKYRVLRPLGPVLRLLESVPLRLAAAVVPVCEALAVDVRRWRPNDVTVLRDVSLLDEAPACATEPSLREVLGITGTLSMYIGNLEPYQGIDLMLESFARLRGCEKGATLVVIGGTDEDIARYRGKAQRLGVQDHVHFLGPKPVSQIARFMAQADILISPRTGGVNTPMKVYSYLHSGVPVLATDLPTHNQVLAPEVARLAPATPGAFADAWRDLLGHRDAAAAMGQRARAFIEHEHSYSAFRRTVDDVYGRLNPQKRADCAPRPSS